MLLGYSYGLSHTLSSARYFCLINLGLGIRYQGKEITSAGEKANWDLLIAFNDDMIYRSIYAHILPFVIL